MNIHGHLPVAQGVLDEIDVSTSTPVEHYAVNFPIGVARLMHRRRQRVEVEGECPDHAVLLEAEVLPTQRDPRGPECSTGGGRAHRSISFEPIPAGDYRLRVGREPLRVNSETP